MNRITITIITSLLFSFVFADIYAQELEPIEPQVRKLRGFNSIEVSQGIEVQLSEGADFMVSVEAAEEMLESVLTVVNGNTFKVLIDDRYKRLVFQNMAVKVNVTLPKLAAINASGGSVVHGLTNFTTDNLNITISSNASVKFDKGFTTNELTLLANSSAKFFSMDVSTANKARITAGSKGDITLNLEVAKDIECSGSSHGKITMSGKADEALLSGTSNSELKLKAFQVQRANVVATTSAAIGITVKEFLAATATYKATINYWGKPRKISGEATSGARIR